jgi:hypothetical protein
MRTINNLPLSGMSLRNVREATPAIPLPNPGEGGPVYPGGEVNGETDGAINDTEMNNNSNNSGSNNNSGAGAIPVIPLPNPGEGGAVYPGNNNNNNRPGNNFVPSIPGTIIITYPRPNENCSFCNPGSDRNGKVRFMNASNGYNPFWVYNLFTYRSIPFLAGKYKDNGMGEIKKKPEEIRFLF